MRKDQPLEFSKTTLLPLNPLDPYYPAPNSKVATDAIAEATKLLNSSRPCEEGFNKAIEASNATKSNDLVTEYLWREQVAVRDYSTDLRNLHDSLIYRLGVVERDADADYELDRLLSRDPHEFHCAGFQIVGEYFYKLVLKLKQGRLGG